MPAPIPIRECLRPRCGFRYRITAGSEKLIDCPKCGSPTRLIEPPPMDLEITACPPASTGPQLEILLDNIRSAENVGAMLRTADGAGIRHLHITGMTPSPGQVKVSKAALGAEFTVPWTQHWNGLQAVLDLKSQGYHIWSLEGGEDSVSLFDLQPPAGPRPILLVVGNEIAGVDPQILSESEKVISIPMLGIKKSLNVATALGIAAYTIRFGCT